MFQHFAWLFIFNALDELGNEEENWFSKCGLLTSRITLPGSFSGRHAVELTGSATLRIWSSTQDVSKQGLLMLSVV
jgi:hypothetical protein